jgi:cellobiose phosphorylase
MQSRTCGLVLWTSGEVALFVVRHYLGVNFEQGALTIRPALYPGSPPVKADLRYRQGRLRLEVSGSGPVKCARVNGSKIKAGKDGILRLPADFAGGTVLIQAGR